MPGLKPAKDLPRRLDAAKKLLIDMGGEMKQFYMVMGDFDFVGICKAPDDAVMGRYVLQLGGLGFVRTKTLKAFPETAYHKIIHSLGSTLKPIEAECSTRRFRSDLCRVRAHRGDLCALRPSWARPTTAAAPYGVLLLRALA